MHFFLKTLTWHTHSHLDYSERTQNEENMIFNNKRGQCLAINVIDILKFSTFVFSMVLLCCSFTSRAQIINVDLLIWHTHSTLEN
jgi:hypothetical protein